MSEFTIKRRFIDTQPSYILDAYPEQQEKSVIQIKQWGCTGHTEIEIQCRKLYKTPSGGRGNKRVPFQRWCLNAVEAVQVASVLVEMSEQQLLSAAEQPHITVVTNREKVAYGDNWVYEDIKTSEARVRNRQSRSHMVGLFQRMVEISEDEEKLHAMAHILFDWASKEGGAYEQSRAEKMIEQLGLILKSDLDAFLKQE